MIARLYSLLDNDIVVIVDKVIDGKLEHFSILEIPDENRSK